MARRTSKLVIALKVPVEGRSAECDLAHKGEGRELPPAVSSLLETQLDSIQIDRPPNASVVPGRKAVRYETPGNREKSSELPRPVPDECTWAWATSWTPGRFRSQNSLLRICSLEPGCVPQCGRTNSPAHAEVNESFRLHRASLPCPTRHLVRARFSAASNRVAAKEFPRRRKEFSPNRISPAGPGTAHVPAPSESRNSLQNSAAIVQKVPTAI